MENIKNTPLTPEEIAEIEKQRTISDAEMLKKGAIYKIDGEGGKILEPTSEQIDFAKKEMLSDLKGLKKSEGSEKYVFPEYIEKGPDFIKEIKEAADSGDSNAQHFCSTLVETISGKEMDIATLCDNLKNISVYAIKYLDDQKKTPKEVREQIYKLALAINNNAHLSKLVSVPFIGEAFSRLKMTSTSWQMKDRVPINKVNSWCVEDFYAAEVE